MLSIMLLAVAAAAASSAPLPQSPINVTASFTRLLGPTVMALVYAAPRLRDGGSDPYQLLSRSVVQAFPRGDGGYEVRLFALGVESDRPVKDVEVPASAVRRSFAQGPHWSFGAVRADQVMLGSFAARLITAGDAFERFGVARCWGPERADLANYDVFVGEELYKGALRTRLTFWPYGYPPHLFYPPWNVVVDERSGRVVAIESLIAGGPTGGRSTPACTPTAPSGASARP